ncbi:MAG: PEP-CTERM sorting domain-containing protein [Proteobacteria bacterium]|nr:PEP-CTERM sorting domain-containing protein [Pseudomonadota bacterium]
MRSGTSARILATTVRALGAAGLSMLLPAIAWAAVAVPTTVPEPGTLSLFAIGAAGAAIARRKRRR